MSEDHNDATKASVFLLFVHYRLLRGVRPLLCHDIHADVRAQLARMDSLLQRRI